MNRSNNAASTDHGRRQTGRSYSVRVRRRRRPHRAERAAAEDLRGQPPPRRRRQARVDEESDDVREQAEDEHADDAQPLRDISGEPKHRHSAEARNEPKRAQNLRMRGSATTRQTGRSARAGSRAPAARSRDARCRSRQPREGARMQNSRSGPTRLRAQKRGRKKRACPCSRRRNPVTRVHGILIADQML